MKFTQYYLECLSQASYLIGDPATSTSEMPRLTGSPSNW